MSNQELIGIKDSDSPALILARKIGAVVLLTAIGVLIFKDENAKKAAHTAAEQAAAAQSEKLSQKKYRTPEDDRAEFENAAKFFEELEKNTTKVPMGFGGLENSPTSKK